MNCLHTMFLLWNCGSTSWPLPLYKSMHMRALQGTLTGPESDLILLNTVAALCGRRELEDMASSLDGQRNTSEFKSHKYSCCKHYCCSMHIVYCCIMIIATLLSLALLSQHAAWLYYCWSMHYCHSILYCPRICVFIILSLRNRNYSGTSHNGPSYQRTSSL